MLPILEAIRTVISRYVAQIVPLAAQADTGSTVIEVMSTRRYRIGDQIVIYNKPDLVTQAEGQVLTIEDVIDRTHLVISPALLTTYPLATSSVQKLIGYTGDGNPRYLQAIYLGDPPVIPRYPAITVNGKSKSNEWLTLESTKADYEIEISIYIDGSDYEDKFKLMNTWANQIENGLFRTMYPLVDPYILGTLAEDIVATDDTFKVTSLDLDGCILGWIFFEDYDRLIPNWIQSYLGNGVYQLIRPVGFDFSATDTKILRPLTHVYNSFCRSINYGVLKGGMISAAKLNYMCSVEQKRLNPMIDPLTF